MRAAAIISKARQATAPTAPCPALRAAFPGSPSTSLRPTSSLKRPPRPPCPGQTRSRSTLRGQDGVEAAPKPQRALLYVPGSNQKMLDKMLRLDPASRANSQSDALATPDVLTLDLEDSVRMEKKSEARRMVTQALQASASTDSPSRKFVRINPGQAGLDDLDAILSAPGLDGLLLPKVNSAADVQAVTRFIDEYGSETYRRQLRVIASIESPLGLLNLREIATSERVGGLLFAAEDYCASSRLIRTPSRLEMLYARSCVVAAAHAFGLSAIDLVCVKYKGEEAERILVEEAEEGRRLGFTGKQAIHPAQVAAIQRAFAPSPAEITRAQAILDQYESARESGRGAYGLQGADGQTEMIDAPMLLQARSILDQARASGLV